VNKEIVEKAKELMYKQTEINKSPSWLLTCIAIQKGRELATKYNVDENIVLTSLYLQHTVFSPIWNGEIQKNHPKLSAEFSKKYLEEWKVPKEEQDIILNAIEAHHNAVETKSLIAEVVKNAECYKFITVKGAMIWLHELGKRGVTYEEAVTKVIAKMEQKMNLLTFDECKEEANINCEKIRKIFNED